MPDPSDAEAETLRQTRQQYHVTLALLSFAVGLVLLGAVVAGLTTPADVAGMAWLRLPAGSAPYWREALRDVTALGSFSVLGLAVVAVAFFLVARRRFSLAALFLMSALGATAFSSLLKLAVDRARPDAAEALALTFTRSFPSGHALLSAAILLTIGGFLSVATPGTGARRAIWVVAGGVAVLVGLSRVMLGVHWPSDVLAGWLFGLGWSHLTLHLAGRSLHAGPVREP